ncbi:MAG: hypothetical protein RL660_2402 [Bacteroidota bacterium]|jgi:hypothetical protein
MKHGKTFKDLVLSESTNSQLDMRLTTYDVTSSRVSVIEDRFNNESIIWPEFEILENPDFLSAYAEVNASGYRVVGNKEPTIVLAYSKVGLDFSRDFEIELTYAFYPMQPLVAQFCGPHGIFLGVDSLAPFSTGIYLYRDLDITNSLAVARFGRQEASLGISHSYYLPANLPSLAWLDQEKLTLRKIGTKCSFFANGVLLDTRDYDLGLVANNTLAIRSTDELLVQKLTIDYLN